MDGKYLIEILYLILKYYLGGGMDVPLCIYHAYAIYILYIYTVQYPKSIATGL